MHLIIKMENRWTIFNGAVHPDLQADFYGRCLEIYNTYFLKELLQKKKAFQIIKFRNDWP